MNTFFILAGQSVTVLLSQGTLTSLHFQEPLSFCDRGISDKQHIFQYRREKKSIAIFPLVNKLKSNMTCYFKNSDRILTFNLETHPKAHKNIRVHLGEGRPGGSLVLSRDGYKVFENRQSYLIKNTSSRHLEVNGIIVKSETSVSKWSPLDIDGKKVFL